jgi:hypothetical protein
MRTVDLNAFYYPYRNERRKVSESVVREQDESRM